MVNQGLWGAVEQYWTVEEKPRLHRRNTYFEDHPKELSNFSTLKLGIVACSVVITIVISALVGGMML